MGSSCKKEDNQPAQSWKLGRIEEIYPGQDGAVRVVNVRTSQGIYQRPITKICPLPIEDNEDSKEELEDPNVSASPSQLEGSSGGENVRALTEVDEHGMKISDSTAVDLL